MLYALEIGVRHIDTAACYRNEKSVGMAIRKSAIDRSEIFVVTKVQPKDMKDEQTVYDAVLNSLANLQMDYVNLYVKLKISIETSELMMI